MKAPATPPKPDVYTEPMTVIPCEGAVVVTGPDAVAVALSPEAAEASARLLIEAARRARAS